MADCHNCGQPAQHEASAFPRGWLPYCCACFNHEWSQQRLIAGQQCGKVPVIAQHEHSHRWEWRKDQ